MKTRSNKGILIVFFVTHIIVLLCQVNTGLALCSISTTAANFGSYNVLSPGALDTVSSITVDCDEAPPPTVTISIGPSPNSGGFDPRKMKKNGGSDLINYNLFIDPGRTQIWGNGSNNTFTAQNKVKKKDQWISTVYGRIPPRQDVSAGSYSETLTVTIIW